MKTLGPGSGKLGTALIPGPGSKTLVPGGSGKYLF